MNSKKIYNTHKSINYKCNVYIYNINNVIGAFFYLK